MSEGEANLTLMELDRGLRSIFVGDQCQAIIKFLQFFDKYPFPIFINSAYLKLADFYRTGTNFLRFLIFIVFQESHKHIDKMLNLEELLKRIFTLFYSNDPLARAITLKLLASMSNVVSEHTHVHHFIQTSLDSHDHIEAESAIYACEMFCKQSSFSLIICHKLDLMVESLATPPNIKLKVIPIFQYMFHNMDSHEKALTSCHNLLKTHLTHEFTLVTLQTLTNLALNSKINISSHIDILLDYIIYDLRSEIIVESLKMLKYLAKFITGQNNKHSPLYTGNSSYVKIFNDINGLNKNIYFDDNNVYALLGKIDSENFEDELLTSYSVGIHLDEKQLENMIKLLKKYTESFICKTLFFNKITSVTIIGHIMEFICILIPQSSSNSEYSILNSLSSISSQNDQIMKHLFLLIHQEETINDLHKKNVKKCFLQHALFAYLGGMSLKTYLVMWQHWPCDSSAPYFDNILLNISSFSSICLNLCFEDYKRAEAGMGSVKVLFKIYHRGLKNAYSWLKFLQNREDVQESIDNTHDVICQILERWVDILEEDNSFNLIRANSEKYQHNRFIFYEIFFLPTLSLLADALTRTSSKWHKQGIKNFLEKQLDSQHLLDIFDRVCRINSTSLPYFPQILIRFTRLLFCVMPSDAKHLSQVLSPAFIHRPGQDEPPLVLDCWTMYRIAIVAMQHDHHQSACQILETIKSKASSLQNAFWLKGLFQITGAENFFRQSIKVGNNDLTYCNLPYDQKPLALLLDGLNSLKVASRLFPLVSSADGGEFGTDDTTTTALYAASNLSFGMSDGISSSLQQLRKSNLWFSLKFTQLRVQTFECLYQLNTTLNGLIKLPIQSLADKQLLNFDSTILPTDNLIHQLEAKRRQIYKKRFSSLIHKFKELAVAYKSFYSSDCFDCDSSTRGVLGRYIDRVNLAYNWCRDYCKRILPIFPTTPSNVKKFNDEMVSKMENFELSPAQNRLDMTDLLKKWRIDNNNNLNKFLSESRSQNCLTTVSMHTSLLQKTHYAFWRLLGSLFALPNPYPLFYFKSAGFTIPNIVIKPQSKKPSHISLTPPHLNNLQIGCNPKDPATYISSRLDLALAINIEGILLYVNASSSSGKDQSSMSLGIFEGGGLRKDEIRKIKVDCFYTVAILQSHHGSSSITNEHRLVQESLDSRSEESDSDSDADSGTDAGISARLLGTDINEDFNPVINDPDLQSTMAHQTMARIYQDTTVLRRSHKRKSNPNLFSHEVTVLNDYFSTQFLLEFPIIGFYTVQIACSLIDSSNKIWKTGPYTQIHVKIT